MKKILVTGANGFIGQNIYKNLIKLNYFVSLFTIQFIENDSNLILMVDNFFCINPIHNVFL
jgi:nucleoside-diphosphate-sugar epimerase